MNTTHVWIVLAVIGTILTTATIVSKVLIAKHGHSPTLDNLLDRVQAWWMMVVVLLLAFLFGRAATVLLFMLISFLALREFLSLIYRRRADYFVLVGVYYVVLPYQYWLVYDAWYGLFSIFIPVYAFLLMPIVASLAGDTERFLTRSAKIQWALMISVFCVSHVPALLFLHFPGYDSNIALLIFLIAVVQASDVLQYICGKLWGKRKIVPSLSPSKTVVGTLGGIALATMLAASLWWMTPFTPFEAAALGLLIAVMGFLGGLVMSAIKRDIGVKDWGSMLSGHGGMLDRIDSLCFAAPIFFHVVRYLWRAG
ncbi:phosphatidate cytidylyltransferase [Suttonella sp. R2A3]|uniref:phosphatidate cytidylyltransferase n=1 Tax=Suttonella sp. R2A3 TaxID=2908648 RepID=UPI001F2B3743|nr:phosphatidate cytidylyltransferase [Suttonella sp. R2A3]UJF24902.1 phosphatidate cytidylyltransferase [Suttonella sp. R2A3]